MKIIALNCTYSSGGAKVMLDIASVAIFNNYEYYVFTPSINPDSPDYCLSYSSSIEHKINIKIGQILGYDNAFLKFGTLNLIRKIKKMKPDVIHIHGIHNWSVDYKILFRFLEKTNIKIVWTQHDCWSFTGKCPYYISAKCNKWVTGCYSCPQLLEYPKSNYFDNSKFMYNYKKKCFTNLSNLTIVTVSKWLSQEVHKSYLNKYKIEVIQNAIDYNKYKNTSSDLRQVFNLQNNFIILCVASGWSRRKGFEDVINLAKELRKFPNNCKIVIIGVSKLQMETCLKNGILGLQRTDDISSIVNWYSTADVFFNPSLEETFGLVTAEAMACGTPIIVYNSTASPELIEDTDNFCVEPHDIKKIIKCINEIRIKGKDTYKVKNISRVINSFNKYTQYEKYLKLYDRIVINN